ncbi:hypothetical protein M595_0422 [Lyngbya aestuarii BL J]|uniref:Uncharacterized protein n=1 Tax=Lyngbya aestuarii BL J TaxID=1348334 RepID=U7QR77_9CYAN|nr:hypothetical protein [Lyngbya aestuarii]ERT09625.1 hypothetical protein M595_0422 [Lyngbya aestuarii BL J]
MLKPPTALFHPQFILKVLQQMTIERFSTVKDNLSEIPTIVSE